MRQISWTTIVNYIRWKSHCSVVDAWLEYCCNSHYIAAFVTQIGIGWATRQNRRRGMAMAAIRWIELSKYSWWTKRYENDISKMPLNYHLFCNYPELNTVSDDIHAWSYLRQSPETIAIIKCLSEINKYVRVTPGMWVGWHTRVSERKILLSNADMSPDFKEHYSLNQR